MGSRYGGLKQLDPVGPGGETIIDYSIYDAMQAGFAKLVFVIRRDIEGTFRKVIGRKFENKIGVEYVFQELSNTPAWFRLPPQRQKPWGTGHAILIGRDAARGPFGVVNADDFYGRTSFRLLADQLRANGGDHDFAMVGFALRNTLSEHGCVSRGVCECDANGFLRSITEFTKIQRGSDGATVSEGRPLHGGEIVSMNMWGFDPSIFRHLEQQFAEFLRENGQQDKAEFFIPSVVGRLVGSGQERVRVLHTPDSWLGVTYQKTDRRWWRASATGWRAAIIRSNCGHEYATRCPLHLPMLSHPRCFFVRRTLWQRPYQRYVLRRVRSGRNASPIHPPAHQS